LLPRPASGSTLAKACGRDRRHPAVSAVPHVRRHKRRRRRESAPCVRQGLGREEAEIAQLRIEYDPQPPFDAGHPDKASEEVRAKATAAIARDARNTMDLISILRSLWRRAIDKARVAAEGRERSHFSPKRRSTRMMRRQSIPVRS
jgi:hypothetical protein